MRFKLAIPTLPPVNQRSAGAFFHFQCASRGFAGLGVIRFQADGFLELDDGPVGLTSLERVIAELLRASA